MSLKMPLLRHNGRSCTAEPSDFKIIEDHMSISKASIYARTKLSAYTYARSAVVLML